VSVPEPVWGAVAAAVKQHVDAGVIALGEPGRVSELAFGFEGGWYSLTIRPAPVFPHHLEAAASGERE
jgi:hypothetical protein